MVLRKCVIMKVRGSMTVEAALVLPLSFYAVYIFFCLFLQIQLQLVVQGKLNEIGSQLAKYGAVHGYLQGQADEKEQALLSELGFDRLAGKLVDSVYLAMCMEDKMEDEACTQYVKGKEHGFDFGESVIYGADGVVDLRVAYIFQTPAMAFFNGNSRIVQRVKTRAFRGNDIYGEYEEIEPEEEKVYITEKGDVFHTNTFCTYLKVNIKRVLFSDISNHRNASGGKYYPCKICKKQEVTQYVFITAYGTTYHTIADCWEICKNINSITRSEAEGKGMRQCSKCAREESK